jgi:acetyl esterase/lipase
VINRAAPSLSPIDDPSNTEHVAVLTTDGGTWGGTPPMTLAYQWEDCNSADPSAAGFACVPATGDGDGATSASFTPGWSDVSTHPRVKVTDTDSASPPTSGSAVSPPARGAVQPEWLRSDVTCSSDATPRGTILYLHAGGFMLVPSLDGAQQICAEWAARGYAVDVVAYPLADPAGAEVAVVQDAATAAVRPVFAIGESAGGTLAEWLAVHGDVAGAVSVSGISDLTTWGPDAFWDFIENTMAQRAAASPLEAVASVTSPAPLLLFASPDDTSVIASQQSQLLYTALQTACGACVTLTPLTGDHLLDLSWKDPAAAWMDALVQQAPAGGTAAPATQTPVKSPVKPAATQFSGPVPTKMLEQLCASEAPALRPAGWKGPYPCSPVGD